MKDGYFFSEAGAREQKRINDAVRASFPATLPTEGNHRDGRRVLSADTEYKNYFAVSLVTDNQGVVTGVKVYDGGDTSSSVAGYTDVAPYPVAVATLALPSAGSASLYLYIDYDAEANTYSQGFDWSRTGHGAVEEIATIVRVSDSTAPGGYRYTLTQRWTGGAVHWRWSYIL